LDEPFWVYGTIIESSNPASGAVISIQDVTTGSAVIDVTTGSNGKYTIDISSIVNDGDVISIAVDTTTGRHMAVTTSVDVSLENINQDFTITGLTDPYWVYGTVKQYGAVVNGAIVSAQDTTLGSAILTQTTGANGQFTIDIETIAEDGDTIMVWVDTPTGGYKSETFVLDASGTHMRVDMEIESPPCIFSLMTDTSSWLLTMPETIIYDDARQVRNINLWDSLYTLDLGKDTESIILSGHETNKDYIDKTDLALDLGEEITISGFGDSGLDGVWVGESFTYEYIIPGLYSYNLRLERVR
jgi:hypothetical protein